MRVGVPAITTRGLKEKDMDAVVEFVDTILMNTEDEALISKTKGKVKEFMEGFPLYPGMEIEFV